MNNPFINIEVDSEEGILGHVYENSEEYMIIYTSEQAQDLCLAEPEILNGDFDDSDTEFEYQNDNDDDDDGENGPPWEIFQSVDPNSIIIKDIVPDILPDTLPDNDDPFFDFEAQSDIDSDGEYVSEEDL